MTQSTEIFLEILAQSLHYHSYYGESKSWETPDIEQIRKVTDDVDAFVARYYMREDSKQEWREMAKRFVDQIVPKVLKERNFELTADNVVDFATAKNLLKTAGGEPPQGENWLRDLPPGTVFLSRPKPNQGKPKQPYCDQFCVIEHKTVTTNLVQKMPTGQQVDIWFPTLEFSRTNDFIEITAQVKFDYTEEQMKIDENLPEEGESNDGTDGSGSRSV